MEILEALVVAFDGCMCFLEMAALFSNGTAAYSGYRTYQGRKRAAETRKEHPETPARSPSWWPFVVLLIFAIGFTVLVMVKYGAMRR